MKSILIASFFLLPTFSFGESANVTLQSLDSMRRADENAQRICRNIDRDPGCVTYVREMESVLGLSVVACRASFNSLNCAQVVRDRYPEFLDEVATCSTRDVCQQALVSNFGRGCGRFGIQVRDQFVSAIQSMNACVQDWSCIGRSMLSGIADVLMPGRAVARAVTSTIQSVRDDINRAQVMSCFNSVTQAQFACHLLVKYGMAVATAGRGAAMLGRMGSLEALMRLPPMSIIAARRLAAQQSRRLASSGRFRFFNRNRREATVALNPGESYVVVVHEGKVVIGERYVNPQGRTPTAGTHLMLFEDLTGRPMRSSYQGGAIRMNRDGSFDVSGYRRARADQPSADAIAAAIREAVPGARVRVTADRLSSLQ